MKICMLASSYPLYAGETTAPFIEEFAAGVARAGHEVTLLLPYHPQLRRAPVEREVRIIPFRYAPHPALNVWGYAQSMRADVRLRGRALLAAPLALLASLGAILRVVGEAELAAAPFDLLHAHWVIPNGLPVALAAAIYRRPYLLSLHGSDVHVAGKYAALTPLAAALLRGARAVTAPSADLLERALRIGAPVERAHLLHYGVDPAAFAPDPQRAARSRAALGLAAERPLIVALGRMVYKKGFGDLIAAMPALLQQQPQAVLVLAGYGDLRVELERQTAELGLQQHVLFPGQLEREQVADLIAAADVYVVPSVRDQAGNVDGLPNTLLEGMAAARPIVATRVAGIPEVITDGQHGLLVAERSPEQLAVAIGRLLADPALARQLGAQARRRIWSELTWNAVVARLLRLYGEQL